MSIARVRQGDAGQNAQQRTHAAQQPGRGGTLRGGAFLRPLDSGAPFQQIAQRDQGAEDLVPRLQTDQALGSAKTARAAAAQSIKHGGASKLDRIAHGAAMPPRVRLPHRGIDGLASCQRIHVAGQRGERVVDLGDRLSGSAVRVHTPDHQRQHRRPHRPDRERPANWAAIGTGSARSSDSTMTVLSNAPSCSAPDLNACEGGGEQGHDTDRQSDDGTEAAEYSEATGDQRARSSEAEQHRNAPAHRAAGIAKAGQQSAQRRFS